MGRDLYDNSPAAKAVMDRVAQMEGLGHIPDLCFNGPDELLTRTDNVQPAITAVSLMAIAAIREEFYDSIESVVPAACAGHSLGEYAAHAAAGNLSEEQVMQLVRWRGQWMNEASQPPNQSGAMAAVMGLPLEKLEKIVKKIGADKIAVANINSRVQIILSGTVEAIEEAVESAKIAGAKKCVPLNVSGAWHSPLMESAQDKMAELVNQTVSAGNVSFSTNVPLVANATGTVIANSNQMAQTLIDQITSPVRWEACVTELLQVTGFPNLPSELTGEERDEFPSWPLFVEMGPGKVLKGLLRGIDKKLTVANVEETGDLERLRELVE